MRGLLGALATTERRKQALVLLVAVPLVLAFGAGLALGALAERGAWSAPEIVLLGAAALAAAALAGRRLLGAAQSVRRLQTAAWLPEKLAPLRIEVAAGSPRRVNIIHPSIDLKHFFGGFIAVFNLAGRLARRGHLVRLIAPERSDLPADWRQQIGDYQGLGGVLGQIEFCFAEDRSQPVQMNPRDALIATHWTAAHLAHAAAAELEREGFVYLIQEYEPSIFAMGSAAALARQSYDLPHRAIFSTGLLRNYFAAHGIGVFAAGSLTGERDSAVFDNAITPVGPVSAADLERPGPPRLLFYARPERHAERNLFELGLMALDRAAAGGHLDGWTLVGVGSVEPGARRLLLPRSGAELEMIPRRSQAEYASLLRGSDIGLALMYTAHPSLVPIEMSAAGMVTVTNTFENKDEAGLARISSNLIAAPPTVEGVAAGLAEARERAADLPRRAEGSRVNWPTSWDEALGEPVLAAIERLL